MLVDILYVINITLPRFRLSIGLRFDAVYADDARVAGCRYLDKHVAATGTSSGTRATLRFGRSSSIRLVRLSNWLRIERLSNAEQRILMLVLNGRNLRRLDYGVEHGHRNTLSEFVTFYF